MVMVMSSTAQLHWVPVWQHEACRGQCARVLLLWATAASRALSDTYLITSAAVLRFPSAALTVARTTDHCFVSTINLADITQHKKFSFHVGVVP